MPDQPTTKRCPGCKTVLPFDAFGKDRRGKFGLDNWCKACRKRARKARYDSDPAHHVAQVMAWRVRNKAAYLAAQKRWRQTPKGQLATSRNNARQKETGRTWAKAHPDRAVEKVMRRDAVKRGLPAEKIDRRALWDRDKGVCHICGKPVPFDKMTLDHVIPQSLGGPYLAWNLRPAHRACNSRRGAGVIPAQGFLPLTD